MLVGVTALLTGVVGTLIAMATLDEPLFFLVAVLAGAGFGAGFQGAIRTVVPFAATRERCGRALDPVRRVVPRDWAAGRVAGFFVVHGGGLLTTAREYAVAAMLLVALAIVGLVRTPASASLQATPAR
jgi:hypothetical protein